MSAPARPLHDLPPHGRPTAGAQAPRTRFTEEVESDVEALLDEVVRELFGLGLGIAGALRQVEGPVADRLSAVLDDADRLIRTVRSAAPAMRTAGPAR